MADLLLQGLALIKKPADFLGNITHTVIEFRLIDSRQLLNQIPIFSQLRLETAKLFFQLLNRSRIKGFWSRRIKLHRD